MSPVETVLLLLLVAILLAQLAERLRIAYPILLVLGGLALGFVPGLPQVTLEPSLVFTLFLPPLLFAAAFFMPWGEFKANLRPILLHAFGLVAVTTVAVAYVAHWLIGLPLAAGFVLGAIVSPPDAIAATSIGERLHLPRRVLTVIEGENLVNDASGLVLFQVALAAVVTGTFSFGGVSLDLVKVAIGGSLWGLAVGWVTVKVHSRLDDPGLITALSLLTPFAAYLPAEHLHLSGVLATVAAGIYVGSAFPVIYGPATRIKAELVWDNLIFLLNGLVFILIGLQLPVVVAAIAGIALVDLVIDGLLISLVVIVVRVLWVFPATYLPRWLIPGLARRDPYPPWQHPAVLSWAGMRGIVSLAAALSVPLAIPERPVILFIAFTVILVTLVFQGLTLPPIINWLGICETEDPEHELEVRRFALDAALQRLDELAAAEQLSPLAIELMRATYRHRLRVLGSGDAAADTLATEIQVRREALAAERAILNELRLHEVVPPEVFRKLQRELDLQATQLEELARADRAS